MSATRRPQAWWVVCLTAGLFAPPLWAAGTVAEAGAVSRAVEVAPPKGWTPDTPLFQEEPSPRSREAAPLVLTGEGAHAAARRGKPAGGRDSAQPAPTQVKGKAGAATALAAKRGRTQGKAEGKLAVNASKKVSGKASSKASPKASPKAQVAAGAARSAQAGKKTAQAPRAMANLRADRQAAKRPDRVAANKRSASATQPVSKPATRSAGGAAVRGAKTQGAQSKARRGVREPTLARRAPKRGTPEVERGGRSGVTKG